MLHWFLIIALLCFICLKHVQKRKRDPPGPLGFPFVGLLPLQIIQILFSRYLPKVSQMKLFRKMKENYGDYWSIEMGGQRIVVLASYEMVTEALINNGRLFTARPINEVYKFLSKSQGINAVSGEIWTNNRKLLTKGFRELGTTSNIFSTHICDESNEFIKYLISISSSPVNTLDAFLKLTSNITSKLAFDDRDNYDGFSIEEFSKNLKLGLRSEVFNTKCNIFPKFATTKLARYLFSDLDSFFSAWENITDFIIDKCKNHSVYQNKNENPKGVFEHFWRNRYPQHPDMTFDSNKLDVYQTINDIYNAGVETIANFFVFSCLLLGYSQDIQDSLRKEVDGICDDYKYITMDSRKSCPKLLSFIDEIHRYCVVIPFIPRAVIQKFTFKGFELYPDDIILGDWNAISKDGKLFRDPFIFDPYRFMDDSKTKYIQNKHVIPFGMGKRGCMGETIANTEEFLILAKIIKVFHISLSKEVLDNFDNILEGNLGIIHGALDHDIIFKLLQNP